MPQKNQELPGIEGEGVARPKIKAIDSAADKYIEIRDSRMALTEKEVAAKLKLAMLMRDHKLTEYVYDDHKVVLQPGKENVKVRTIHEGDDDGDDE